jgi:hypothetical protein
MQILTLVLQGPENLGCANHWWTLRVRKWGEECSHDALNKSTSSQRLPPIARHLKMLRVQLLRKVAGRALFLAFWLCVVKIVCLYRFDLNNRRPFSRPSQHSHWHLQLDFANGSPQYRYDS